ACTSAPGAVLAPYQGDCRQIGPTLRGGMSETMRATDPAAPALSVVVPVKNEAGNVGPLAEEIAAVLTGRWSFEVVFVNDGSGDKTAAELNELAATRPWLRHVTHRVSCGQSAAVRTGVAAARAPLIATMDGDGQNDPSFIPALVQVLEKGGPKLGL